MKIEASSISLVGFVVGGSLIDAMQNLQAGATIHDTEGDAMDSWNYRSNDGADIYKVETRISGS